MSSVPNFTRFAKAPDTRLDYTVDWSKWLEPLSGDTITDVDWTVPTGIDIPTDPTFAPFFTTTAATIWLEGGTLGVNYDIVCHITTAAQRTEDHTFIIVCQHK